MVGAMLLPSLGKRHCHSLQGETDRPQLLGMKDGQVSEATGLDYCGNIERKFDVSKTSDRIGLQCLLEELIG
jgi:hypothetical protein